MKNQQSVVVVLAKKKKSTLYATISKKTSASSHRSDNSRTSWKSGRINTMSPWPCSWIVSLSWTLLVWMCLRSLRTESYPRKAPDIIITAPRLTPDQILLVQQLLQSHSASLLNRPMILSVHSRLLQWLDENKIQTLSANMNNVTPTLPTTPRSPPLAKFVSPFIVNNQNRISQYELNDHEQVKPCSTRTIEDVLAHIEVDHRLDKRYIRVGFLDRLLGLQEKLYQEFDWQTDPSTIHERSTVPVAIPKCSIQYVKYGNEIIWDKENRLDLILGSNSNQQILDDIINRHRNLLESMNSPL